MTDRVRHIIIGLGNPGAKYVGTRHNVGFAVINSAAKEMGNSTFVSGCSAEYMSIMLPESNVIMAKPQTFMNVSGWAVRQLMDMHKVLIQNVLIVLDDINLPLGHLRLRSRGSDGGHNGLASIITELGTEKISRLRVGVGSKVPLSHGDMIPFVLGKFSSIELELLNKVTTRTVDAIFSFISHGLELTMNKFNNNNFLPQNS